MTRLLAALAILALLAAMWRRQPRASSDQRVTHPTSDEVLRILREPIHRGPRYGGLKSWPETGIEDSWLAHREGYPATGSGGWVAKP